MNKILELLNAHRAATSERARGKIRAELSAWILVSSAQELKWYLDTEEPKKWIKAARARAASLTNEDEATALHIIRFGPRPQCYSCGKPVFLRHNGYSDSCSVACANKSPTRRSNVSEGLTKKVDFIARRRKSDETKIHKYGTLQQAHKAIRAAGAKTNLTRYGATCNLHAPSIKEKKLKTWERNYGVTNPAKAGEVSAKFTKSNRENFIAKTIQPRLKELEGLNNVIPVFKKYASTATEHTFLHKTCGSEFSVKNFTLVDIKCPICFPRVTGEEHKIIKILDEAGIKYELHNREVIAPLELDIWIPEHKIGIEVNGVYWHSSAFTGTSLLEKTKKQDLHNITVLHFWDYEINKKIDVIRSMILARLKKTKRVYARMTEVCQISAREARDFFDTTHLHGFCGAAAHLALKYDGKFVQVMSFGRSRFDKDKTVFEIIRSASALNTTCVGGVSKLLSAFKKMHKGRIITYADRRFSTGASYLNSGFKFDGFTKPGFFYTRGRATYSRQAVWGDLIYKFAPDYDTACEIRDKALERHGYFKCFDSGHMKFVLL